MPGLPLFVGRSPFPRRKGPRRPTTPAPRLLGMWEPILRGDFFGRCFLLGLCWATCTHGRHDLGLLLGAEVLAVLAKQVHDLREGVGGLLLAELGLLLFELPKFLLQLGLGGGDGVEGGSVHQIAYLKD